MRGLVKNKKKKGFTLIEMVAVVAIIGILAAILVPKVTGYMNEAKKTEIVDQARKVTQAYETAKMKGKDQDNTTATHDVDTDTTVDNIENPTMLSLLDVADKTAAKALLTKLDNDTTIGECQQIVAGAEITVGSDGTIENIVTK
ncbi:MAG: type II secretion system protein [Clostridium sp.]|uniref:type II secretion system protein n=1 Tax=Clostridium sp. TaxID=1506 RepID=UPI003EE4CCC8